jgi:hypothetical protein
MPQYAIVWHTDHYTDPSVFITTTDSVAKAEKKLKASYKKELGIRGRDELYIDAVIEGKEMVTCFASGG